MADGTMLDTEFLLWSPTFGDKGGNPTKKIPAGASIAYSTDNTSIAPLQFASPDNGESPDLNPDGTEGTYVRSGTVGTANLTATPGGTIASWATKTASVEVQDTEANSINMTFAKAKPEFAPAG